MYVCGSTRRRAIVEVSEGSGQDTNVKGVPETKLASARFKNDLVFAIRGS
jgi:hypothetical protein